jgi:hypothetical protein
VPVRVALIGGNRYVMTMLGDAQWARNLRASGTAQLLYRGHAETVTARELSGDGKTRFLATLCRDPRFGRRARTVLRSVLSNRNKDLDDTSIRLLGNIWHPFQLSPIQT